MLHRANLARAAQIDVAGMDKVCASPYGGLHTDQSHRSGSLTVEHGPDE